MKASFEAIMYEMEKYKSKPSTQIKCVNMLFPILKVMKSLDSLIQTFSHINTGLNESPDNTELQMACLALFDDIMSQPNLYSFLSQTDIPSLICFILYSQKDNKELSEVGLKQIARIIRIEKLRPYFSNEVFLEHIIYIARVNAKSNKHVKYILDIADNLNTDQPLIKDLCSTLIIFSRESDGNESIQEEIIDKFYKLSNDSILQDIGSAAIVQFNEICISYPKNIKILMRTLQILDKSENDFPQRLLPLILKNWKRIQKDNSNVAILVQIFAKKLSVKNTPKELLPIAFHCIQTFLPSVQSIKHSLKFCYNCVSPMIVVSKDLIISLTDVINYHKMNRTIVKQAAVIMIGLAKAEQNIIAMSEAVTPLAAYQAAIEHIGDEKTVSILCGLLSIAVDGSDAAAGQLKRSEFLNGLRTILKQYPSGSIMKSLMVALEQIALVEYSFLEFIDLPDEKKEMYQIDGDIASKIISENMDDIDVVKAAIFLSKGKNQTVMAKAMRKYNGDECIQICGLANGVSDEKAIETAITVCGEDCLRFVIPFLSKSNEKLPSHIIEFLLSCDRADTTQILIRQLDQGYYDIISPLFELCFIQHLPIAMRLAKKDLWRATESDADLIITVLNHTVLDKELFKSALFFATNFFLDENTIPALIDGISNYPEDEDIIVPCSRFITAFKSSQQMCACFYDSTIVRSATYALELHRKNESVVFEILKLLHLVSYYEEMTAKFTDSLCIDSIIDVSKLSDRCRNESCLIISNLIHSEEILHMIVDEDVADLFFKSFNESYYEVVYRLTTDAGLEINENEFNAIYKHMGNLKTHPTPEDAVSLFSLMYGYLSHTQKPPKIDSKRFISMLSAYMESADVIGILLQIIPYTKEYNSSESLLFSLTEILRNYHDNKTIVQKTFRVLQGFTKGEKYRAALTAPSTTDLLMRIFSIYQNDPMICSTIFQLLNGSPACFVAGLNALSIHNDPAIVNPIAQSVYSASQKIDITPQLSRLFGVLRSHLSNSEVSTALIQSVSACVNNPSSHPVIMKNIHLIGESCVRHSSSVHMVSATLYIISLLANQSRNISQLSVAGHVVGTAMRLYKNDNQVIKLGLGIITKFGDAGSGKVFKHSASLVAMCLRTAHAQAACDAIGSIASSLEEYGEGTAAEVVRCMLKAPNPEPAVRALCEIAAAYQIDRVIFEHAAGVARMGIDTENENVAGGIFYVCSGVKDPKTIDRFEQTVPFLVERIKSNRPSSASAARMLATIAGMRPDLIAPHLNSLHPDKGADPDLIRSCALINEQYRK